MNHNKYCFLLILFVIPMLAGILWKGPMVQAAEIRLSETEKEMSIGESFTIKVLNKNQPVPKFRSSSPAVVSVNQAGKATAKKPGEAVITVKVKSQEALCRIKVHETRITLEQDHIYLEHGETHKTEPWISSGSQPVYKSSHKSVAAVDENGLITGMKPGEAVISVWADGTWESLIVTVNHPVFNLLESKIRLSPGEHYTLEAEVSSQLLPDYRSNRSGIVMVDQQGVLHAVKEGIAVITATVDGVSRVCQVIVE